MNRCKCILLLFLLFIGCSSFLEQNLGEERDIQLNEDTITGYFCLNGNNEEPVFLKKGDTFLEWTLVEIIDTSSDQALHDLSQEMCAVFEGEMLVRGVIIFDQTFVDKKSNYGHCISFYPVDEQFPKWSNSEREGRMIVVCADDSSNNIKDKGYYDIYSYHSNEHFRNLADYFGFSKNKKQFECELLVTRFETMKKESQDVTSDVCFVSSFRLIEAAEKNGIFASHNEDSNPVILNVGDCYLDWVLKDITCDKKSENEPCISRYAVFEGEVTLYGAVEFVESNGKMEVLFFPENDELLPKWYKNNTSEIQLVFNEIDLDQSGVQGYNQKIAEFFPETEMSKLGNYRFELLITRYKTHTNYLGFTEEIAYVSKINKAEDISKTFGMFTNRLNNVPPTQVSIGDMFLGWTLVNINENFGQNDVAVFEGNKKVRGQIYCFSDDIQGDSVLFSPSNNHELPEWYFLPEWCSYGEVDFHVYPDSLWGSELNKDEIYNLSRKYFDFDSSEKFFECELIVTRYELRKSLRGIMASIYVSEIIKV